MENKDEYDRIHDKLLERARYVAKNNQYSNYYMNSVGHDAARVVRKIFLDKSVDYREYFRTRFLLSWYMLGAFKSYCIRFNINTVEEQSKLGLIIDDIPEDILRKYFDDELTMEDIFDNHLEVSIIHDGTVSKYNRKLNND